MDGIRILGLFERLGWRGVLFLILLLIGILLAILGFGRFFPYYDTCPPGPGPALCFHTDYSLNILAQIFGLIFALAGTNGLIRWLRTSHNKTG